MSTTVGRCGKIYRRHLFIKPRDRRPLQRRLLAEEALNVDGNLFEAACVSTCSCRF